MASRALAMKPMWPAIDRRMWMTLIGLGVCWMLGMRELALPSGFILASVIVGFVALAVAGWRSPEIPFYVLVAYLPFSRLLTQDFGAQNTAFIVLYVLMGLVAGAHVRKSLHDGQPLIPSTTLAWLIALFAGLGALSLLRSGWSYGGWYVASQVSELLRWLAPMSLLLLTVAVVQDERTLKTVMTLILLAVLLAAMFAMYEALGRVGHSFDRSRVRGIADHPNVLGAFFVSYMFLFLGLFLTHAKRLGGWLLFLAFPLCVMATTMTFSRGAYLALAVGLLVACCVRNKWLLLPAAALALVISAKPTLLPTPIRHRLEMTWSQMPSTSRVDAPLARHLDTSSAVRLEIWRSSLAIIHDHPWWGVGIGAFQRFIPHYTKGTITNLDAHNAFLLIAAEQGLPTLLVFCLILGLIGFQAYWLASHAQDRTLAGLGLGVLAGLVGLVIANLFTVCTKALEVIGYFWILSGLILRARLMEQPRASLGAHETRTTL